jgi:hypothetical protein
VGVKRRKSCILLRSEVKGLHKYCWEFRPPINPMKPARVNASCTTAGSANARGPRIVPSTKRHANGRAEG